MRPIKYDYNGKISVSNRTKHFDIAGFPGPVLPVGSLSCSFKNTSPIISRSRHINDS